LVQAGLEEIRFSTGGVHSLHVPVERVINGACASASAGIKTRVSIENLGQTEFNIDSILKNSELEGFISKQQIKIKRSVWIQDGGTGEMSHSSDRSQFALKHGRGCSTALQALSVTPDEILVACCGLHLEKIPGLHFGSVRHGSLGRCLQEAPDDFLKIWIHVEGPERIWEFVRRHAPGYKLPLRGDHPCETCLRLFQDETAMQIIRDHYEEVERRIRLIYFARLAFAEVGRAFRML